MNNNTLPTASSALKPHHFPPGSAITRWAKASPDYADKLAATIALLRQACAKYQPITLACSLGAEDMLLLHLLQQEQLHCRVFVLETGRLNPETLELLGLAQQRYHSSERPIHIYRPDTQQAAQFVAEHGENAMYESMELRKACCHIRKMLPLAQALESQRAWITGLRREQSNARAAVPLQEDDSEHQGQPREKFNPLADWTWGDVWHAINSMSIPYNSLHDQLYPSIGCAPCTRAITLGEDFRAGRWWWENNALKECGLHVKSHSDSA